MDKEYKILISSGDFFAKTYRGIRMGENYEIKEVNISGDINESDLLVFAGRLAVSSYKEKVEQQKTDKGSAKMKENITNAFILDADGLSDYANGVPGSCFIKGITTTIPYGSSGEPIIDVFSADDMKRMEIVRSK